MAHPQLFDDDDPFLQRVREMALAFPGAAEKISHGRPAFFTTKVFVYFGGDIRVDGAYVEHAHSLLVHPDEAEVLALAADPRCYRPASLGPSGWIGLDLNENTDWAEVRELIEASYRDTARARLIAVLDAG
ncbi:MmcQ/YjbR family DNA-binding protein [Raineyella fluvialis]|uniref:MmcQ/YjbR family DNA-binding protein n=1 Tax=Raineyella fluvialis TaxID=2662261 RepID=A0A5Q2FEA7_9ACTN|nr:MmcQ/YjbR family DNA-binding protein [Raineyella fluvialis]QGF23804.1 MmcQ/YjbR family DNA-binding protein [Raineyella fluvialis]